MSETIVERPRLRASVDLMTVQQDDEQLVVLYDAAGLTPATITLTPGALFLVTQMTGENSLEDIVRNFHSQFQQQLPCGQLIGMLHQLDRAGMLDSPLFAARYEQIVEAFRSSPVRPCLTRDDEEAVATMREQIRGILSDGESTPNGQSLRGLIAPHLDYARGGPCYSAAYAQFRGQPPFDRYVILGTNHFGRSATAVWTAKDFETPLGVAQTDREFIARLQQRCGMDLAAHELDHLREHSIELQVTLLQAMANSHPFSIVPILCPEVCGPTGVKPADGVGIGLDDLADALADTIRQDAGKRTCLIAGADLSHIGRRFGDDRDLDATFLQDVEAEDKAMLARIEAGDPEEVVKGLVAHSNLYRVCSAGAIYVLLRVLRGAKVRVLKYHQAINPEIETGVTCAAAVVVS